MDDFALGCTSARNARNWRWSRKRYDAATKHDTFTSSPRPKSRKSSSVWQKIRLAASFLLKDVEIEQLWLQYGNGFEIFMIICSNVFA